MTSAPDPLQADALRLLSSSLACLDPEDLQALAADLEWIQLPSGEMLFDQGDPGNSLFIVVQGRLRAFLDQDGKRIPLGDVHRGETVGEMAIITGEPRSASVYAIRHATLALLRREAFERFIETRPAAMLAISRVLVQRLRRVNRSATENHANIAVVPISPGAPVAEFCTLLAETLGRITSARVLTSKHLQECAGVDPSLAFIMGPESGRISAWLSEEEERFDYVIYQADESPTAWTSWCVRQADRVLITAPSDGDPAHGIIGATQLDRHASELRPRRELALLSKTDQTPSGTDCWLATYPVDGHHHVNISSPASIQRLARRITGRAIGVALGGGGARGFAHIGMLRALEEAGIPVDMIGGTSMGSVLAAQYALGLTPADMLSLNQKAWITGKPLGDKTIPVLSFVKGRNLQRMLHGMFGDTLIEDLRRDFFCVSSNLSRAEPMIHRSGLVRDWTYASAALPGIALPAIYQGELLVDGGVLNNVPADIVRELGGGTVIACDVGAAQELRLDEKMLALPSAWEILSHRFLPFKTALQVPSILDIMMRTSMLSSVRGVRRTREQADLYLNPPVGAHGIFEWKSIQAIADIGYRDTLEKLETWTEAGWSVPGA
jgi:NTE family protein/lysophospholipid hydrolase